MVEWWNGGMVEWWNGGMVEWWNGGMVDVRFELTKHMHWVLSPAPLTTREIYLLSEDNK